MAGDHPDGTWPGAGVAARSVPIPGSEGGFRITVVGSFRLWVPSGGTWHVESALTATGVRKADAPGSAYGRVSFGHAVECGPDTRDVAGRLTTPVLTTVSGTNLLYDRTTTTTVRGLWRAVRGYNRCQVVVIVGRDDLAVAGKRFTLNGGYVRLVGRGLADGQTTSIQMSPRMLSRSAPSLTAPNFQTDYTAPSRLAVAGNAQLTPAVRFVDVVADAYVTTCYGPGSRTVTPILRADGTVVATRLACPVSAGLLTPVTYQSMAVVSSTTPTGRCAGRRRRRCGATAPPASSIIRRCATGSSSRWTRPAAAGFSGPSCSCAGRAATPSGSRVGT